MPFLIVAFKDYILIAWLLSILLFILTFIVLIVFLVFIIGYLSTKKRLGGEVALKEKGIEDIEKDGLRFFAPWNLVDFVYFGEYGIYFYVRKRIVIFGDNSNKEEVLKYLEENKIKVLVYNRS